MIIQSPIENEASSTDDFTSFSRRVKHSTQVSVDKMESRLNEKILSIQTKIEKLNVGDLDRKSVNKESEIEKSNLTNLESKIANLESKIEN